MLKKGNIIYISHSFYPLGRYDRNRTENPQEGRIKKGRIEGRTIRWLMNLNLSFIPDYSNIVQDTMGYFWIFTRESKQGIAYRSHKPNDVSKWESKTVCIPEKSRHAIDVAALDKGNLFAASMLTPDGKLYGNLYDGEKWGEESTLISDEVTTVAGDDRRISLEYDPSLKKNFISFMWMPRISFVIVFLIPLIKLITGILSFQVQL